LEIYKNHFSKCVKEHRKQLKLTQKQLGDILNVADATVSGWELGTNYPDMDKVLQLCKIFNLTCSEIFGTINKNSDITLSNKEKELIISYRKHPEVQFSIDKLLGIDEYTSKKGTEHAENVG
jgi:transcriptional regulator with XRE-family HTH domain